MKFKINWPDCKRLPQRKRSNQVRTDRRKRRNHPISQHTLRHFYDRAVLSPESNLNQWYIDDVSF